jgi:hypothetical protein
VDAGREHTYSTLRETTKSVHRNIIIAEHFYSDPEAVTRYAKGLEYVYPYQQPGTPHEGRRITWRASRYKTPSKCPLKSSTRLIESLEALTGETIDRESWNLDFPVDTNGYPSQGYAAVARKSAWWNCCFHVKHDTNQQLGAGVHSHTDRDSWNPVGLDGWAGLVYLNQEPRDRQAGLRTWVNRDAQRQFDWMTPKDNWLLQDTLANVYNRLILHRGNIPHSGTNGWGEALANGRFYQTFFFRTKVLVDVPSISLDDS